MKMKQLKKVDSVFEKKFKDGTGSMFTGDEAEEVESPDPEISDAPSALISKQRSNSVMSTETGKLSKNRISAFTAQIRGLLQA